MVPEQQACVVASSQPASPACEALDQNAAEPEAQVQVLVRVVMDATMKQYDAQQAQVQQQLAAALKVPMPQLRLVNVQAAGGVVLNVEASIPRSQLDSIAECTRALEGCSEEHTSAGGSIHGGRRCILGGLHVLAAQMADSVAGFDDGAARRHRHCETKIRLRATKS